VRGCCCCVVVLLWGVRVFGDFLGMEEGLLVWVVSFFLGDPMRSCSDCLPGIFLRMHLPCTHITPTHFNQAAETSERLAGGRVETCNGLGWMCFLFVGCNRLGLGGIRLGVGWMDGGQVRQLRLNGRAVGRVGQRVFIANPRGRSPSPLALTPRGRSLGVFFSSPTLVADTCDVALTAIRCQPPNRRWTTPPTQSKTATKWHHCTKAQLTPMRMAVIVRNQVVPWA